MPVCSFLSSRVCRFDARQKHRYDDGQRDNQHQTAPRSQAWREPSQAGYNESKPRDNHGKLAGNSSRNWQNEEHTTSPAPQVHQHSSKQGDRNQRQEQWREEGNGMMQAPAPSRLARQNADHDAGGGMEHDGSDSPPRKTGTVNDAIRRRAERFGLPLASMAVESSGDKHVQARAGAGGNGRQRNGGRKTNSRVSSVPLRNTEVESVHLLN